MGHGGCPAPRPHASVSRPSGGATAGSFVPPRREALLTNPGRRTMYDANGAGFFPCRFDGSGENRSHLAIRAAPPVEGSRRWLRREIARDAGSLSRLAGWKFCLTRGYALHVVEAIGGDFKTYVIPENTGKPGSLKKNYGSWKVKRKLRDITPLDKE